jgi:hypothetical protein
MYINGALVQQPGTCINRYSKLGPTLQFDMIARDDETALNTDSLEQRLFYIVGQLPTVDNSHVTALLLRLVDRDKKLFARIGLILSIRTGEHEMLLVELDEGTKSSLPCLRYENGLHTIRII